MNGYIEGPSDRVTKTHDGRQSMRLKEIVLRTVRLPLIRPYVLSYRTFTEFEPIIVEVRDGDGRVGWGEGHISPGSSSETRDGGWTFCREHAAAVVGKESSEAKAIIARDITPSKVAATALLTAIEMLEGHPLLTVDRDARLPLLTPFNSSAPGDIEREVEQRLEDGFRTFKIKVGKSAEDDARRVKLVQRAIAGRATMRLDANCAYSEADACRFAMALDPCSAMVCLRSLDVGWKPVSRASPFAMPASSTDFSSRVHACSPNRCGSSPESLYYHRDLLPRSTPMRSQHMR